MKQVDDGPHALYERGIPVTGGAAVDLSSDVRRRAVRNVCALSVDAEAAALMLDALALDPREGARQ